MYTMSVWSQFVAQHYLIGGDWGLENERHSHQYRVEIRVIGAELNRHGYLLDIVELRDLLAAQVTRFRDRTLNELEDFQGLNPSLEHFARILGESLAADLTAPNLEHFEMRLWEDDVAWAAYHCELPCGSD